MTEQGDSKPADVVVRGDATRFLQEVVSGNHHLRADEPISAGGTDGHRVRTTTFSSPWAFAPR